MDGLQRDVIHVPKEQFAVAVENVDSTHVHLCMTATEAVVLTEGDYILFSIPKEALKALLERR